MRNPGGRLGRRSARSFVAKTKQNREVTCNQVVSDSGLAEACAQRLGPGSCGPGHGEGWPRRRSTVRSSIGQWSRAAIRPSAIESHKTSS
jgi:hypothetical protein